MNVLIILSLLLLLLVASFIWYLWISNKSKGGTPPLPPGPRGLPIVGYLPFVDVNLHKQLANLAHKHGPIFKLWLGSKLYIVISSPSLVKAVVRDHDSVFANRDPPVAAVVATGALDIFWSPNGPYWRDIRKLFVREMLSNKNLQSSYELRVDRVREFVKDLQDKMIGKAVDIGDLVFRIEVNVIMSLLWGATVEGDERDRLGADFRINMSKLVDLLGKPNVSDFFPFLARFDLQGIEKEVRGVLPKLEETIDWIIERRMNMMTNGEGRSDDDVREKDFLEILLELKDHKLGEKSSFGLLQIKAVLMDIIVGGTDTTATTVEWVMAELLKNPDAMQKVKEEVGDVVGLGSNKCVEEWHLPKLRYLEAVVKETMRLHPPLPLIVPRFPTQSTTIGGYTIPRGSRVFLNMWSIYMDPQLWKNPAEFQPSRFLNENGDCDYSGNSFQYLPFGSGRRLCPGLPLAERMVMFLLATLVHSFHWRLPHHSNIDMSETFGIVMRKTTPLFAIPFNPPHVSTST
ncbi:hypothetical protein C2S51_037251 [Perilla frutescens var. frutescens]|nr:hypothetical protein C2S51_037251 [Perilla frutescens var. frutescens]